MLGNDQQNENDRPGATRTRTRSKGFYLQSTSQGRSLQAVLRDTRLSTNNIHRAASVTRPLSPFCTKKSHSSTTKPSQIVYAPTSKSTLTIGRGSHVDIDLGRQYKQISRRHLVITRNTHGEYLLSIEGANGATVDGLNHICGKSNILLRHESILEIGDARFIFHVNQVNRLNDGAKEDESEENWRNKNAETEEIGKAQVARFSSPFSSDATPRRPDHIPIPHKKRKCGYYSLSSEDPRSDGVEPSSEYTATSGAQATPLWGGRGQRKASLPNAVATTPVTEPNRPMSDAYNDNYYARWEKNVHPASTPSRADAARRSLLKTCAGRVSASIEEPSLIFAEDDDENNEIEEKSSTDHEEEAENAMSSSSTSSARQKRSHRSEPSKSREGIEVRYSKEAEELKAAAAAIKFTVTKLPVTTSTTVEKGKVEKKRRNVQGRRMDGNESLDDEEGRNGNTERNGNEDDSLDSNAYRGRAPPSPRSLSIKLMALAKNANHTLEHSRQTSCDMDETENTIIDNEVKGHDRCRKNASSVRSSSLSPLSSVPSSMMFTDSESDNANDDADSDMPSVEDDASLKAKKPTTRAVHSSKTPKRTPRSEPKINDETSNLDSRRPPGGPYNYPSLVADALVFSGKRSLTISDVLDEVAHSIPSVRSDPSIWRHHISKTLFSAPFFVRVERSGKDATGKQREDLWHYDINADPDEGRRENYAEVAKGARSCTLVDKQYYWKPVPRLANWKGGKGWSNSGSENSRRKRTGSSGSKKHGKSRIESLTDTIMEEEGKQEGEDDGLDGEVEVDEWDRRKSERGSLLTSESDG